MPDWNDISIWSPWKLTFLKNIYFFINSDADRLVIYWQFRFHLKLPRWTCHLVPPVFKKDLQSYEFRASTDNVNLEKFNQEKLSKMITDGTLEEVVEIKPGKVPWSWIGLNSSGFHKTELRGLHSGGAVEVQDCSCNGASMQRQSRKTLNEWSAELFLNLNWTELSRALTWGEIKLNSNIERCAHCTLHSFHALPTIFNTEIAMTIQRTSRWAIDYHVSQTGSASTIIQVEHEEFFL